MNRKLATSLGVVWILLALTLTTACSRQDLYDMALAHERERAGLSPRVLDINGRTIALLESVAASDKPTLVLIHGFAANKENWVRFAAHMTDQFHVVAVDLPGHGDSIKDMRLKYGLADQVGYLQEIVTQLQLKQFHLAGNSMGGAISSLYAATYPEQVLTLTLYDPAGIYVHESEYAKQLAQGRNPLIVRDSDDFDALMEFAMEQRPFIPWPIKSVLAERSIANKPINDKIFADIRSNPDVHTATFTAALQRIQAPTLIVWGKQDRVIHYGNADEFERLIPKSRKLILDGVGHAPMIEIPEESARIHREFIQAL